MAEMYNMPLEEIQKVLGGNLENLKADLKVQKAVEFLVENSKTGA